MQEGCVIRYMAKVEQEHSGKWRASLYRDVKGGDPTNLHVVAIRDSREQALAALREKLPSVVDPSEPEWVSLEVPEPQSLRAV